MSATSTCPRFPRGGSHSNTRAPGARREGAHPRPSARWRPRAAVTSQPSAIGPVPVARVRDAAGAANGSETGARARQWRPSSKVHRPPHEALRRESHPTTVASVVCCRRRWPLARLLLGVGEGKLSVAATPCLLAALMALRNKALFRNAACRLGLCPVSARIQQARRSGGARAFVSPTNCRSVSPPTLAQTTWARRNPATAKGAAARGSVTVSSRRTRGWVDSSLHNTVNISNNHVLNFFFFFAHNF